MSLEGIILALALISVREKKQESRVLPESRSRIPFSDSLTLEES